MIGLLTTKLHPHPGDRGFALLGFSAFRSYLKSEINSRKMLPLKSEPLETKKLSPQVAVDARCRQPRPEKTQAVGCDSFILDKRDPFFFDFSSDGK
jgi:hypothetical protein